MILWRPVKKRAILMAFSLASAPPFVKKNVSISPGAISASLAPSRARGSVAMNGLAYASTDACSAIARMTRSSPCPMFTDINWLLKSMNRFPSGVQKYMPFARATGIGSTLDCADHSNRVCFLVRSTISWPVMAGTTVEVVIELLDILKTYSELPRVLLRPALDHNFLFGVELDRIAPLCVHDPEETVLPSAEREICHGRGHANVNADIPRGSFIAKAPSRRTARRKQRRLIAKWTAGHHLHRFIHVAGMNQAEHRTKNFRVRQFAACRNAVEHGRLHKISGLIFRHFGIAAVDHYVR